MILRVTLLASLLAGTAHGFVVPMATVRQQSPGVTALRAGEADVGEILSTAKEALSDATEGLSFDVDIDFGGATDNLDLDFLSSLPPDAAIAAAGVVALVGIAAIAGGGSGGEESASTAPKKAAKKKKGKAIDVSIPYDAAARLAYDTWVESQEDVKASEEAFEAFRTMYEDMAVAEVTAKQKARNLASFDPTKPKPEPKPEPEPVVVAAKAEPAKPAPVAAKKPTPTSTPFFAEVAK